MGADRAARAYNMGSGHVMFNRQERQLPAHSPYILRLKQLGHGKEQIGGLDRLKVLALVQKVDDLAEGRRAASRADRRLIEDARFLEHLRLVERGEQGVGVGCMR